MKKFIRGTFKLDCNITDLEAYEAPKRSYLLSIVEWATDNELELTFGTSADNTYLCEFFVRGNTTAMCNGYLSELKYMLKKEFPKARIVFKAGGNLLW